MSADRMTAPHDVPGADELVEAVREFLERDVMDVDRRPRAVPRPRGGQRAGHGRARAGHGPVAARRRTPPALAAARRGRRSGAGGRDPRRQRSTTGATRCSRSSARRSGQVGGRPSRVHRGPVSEDRVERAERRGAATTSSGEAIGDLAGGRQTSAGGLGAEPAASAVDSMRAGRHAAVATGRWLAEALIDAAPRIPVRDLATLRQQHPGPRGRPSRRDPDPQRRAGRPRRWAACRRCADRAPRSSPAGWLASRSSSSSRRWRSPRSR